MMAGEGSRTRLGQSEDQGRGQRRGLGRGSASGVKARVWAEAKEPADPL